MWQPDHIVIQHHTVSGPRAIPQRPIKRIPYSRTEIGGFSFHPSEYNVTMTAELEAALSMNEAQRLVRHFAEAAARPASAFALPSAPLLAQSPAPESRAATIMRREVVRFELTPWCHLDLDVNELRRHPPIIAQQFG